MSSRILVDEDEPEYDLDEPAFEPRDVTFRKDKWIEEEFDVHGFLGRGKFGEVKKCTEKLTGREFAAKFICVPRPQDKQDVEHELNIMKKLYHRRIIQLYDAFESKTEMCLVLEIIYGGELFDRVISDDFVLTEKACVAFMRQICEGLEYMHANMIIHLDMKPENILCLTRTGNRVKLIDFGLAREYHPKKDLRVLFGTPEFMAPEVVQYETISFGTDMWSVGVICYVLLSGLSPFMGDSDADTLGNVVKGAYDFNYAEFDDVSDDAKDLITKLLVKDKTKRLTASECLSHHWLAKPNGDAIKRQSPSLKMAKKRLKRFVYRRKWQKTVNAIIALRRMGFPITAIQRQPLGEIATTEEIFGRDITMKNNHRNSDINADDIQRSLEAKTYDLNKRKASDSGYESVAVDKDLTKDLVSENDGIVPEIETPAVEELCFSSTTISINLGETRIKDTVSLVSEASFTLTIPKASDKTGSSKTITQRSLAPVETPSGQLSRSSSKTPSSLGSSKEPSPCSSGSVTPKGEGSVKKLSIMDRFGGLFMNKDKDSTPPKKPNGKTTIKKSKEKEKQTEKDKISAGIVKKDSFKRKMKQKQEVYVSTPVVKQKHPQRGATEGETPVEKSAVNKKDEKPEAIVECDIKSVTSSTLFTFTSNKANMDIGRPKNNISARIKNLTGSKLNLAEDTKNGTENNKANPRNGNGGKLGERNRLFSGTSVDDDSVDGSSVDPDEDKPRPLSLYGNVKSKRKMFENSNGRAS